MEKMWGGVFNKDTKKIVEDFTKSIKTDKVLVFYDIEYSKAHAKALEKAGVISKQECKKITEELNKLYADVKSGKKKIQDNFEDIHSFVENYLNKRLKKIALKLHAGRSRNDQIVVLTKMYSKNMLEEILKSLKDFQKALLKLAKKEQEIIMPAFTHMQDAQPVLFAHYILSFIEMLERDKQRFNNIFKQVSILPSGSAACVGTNIKLDLDLIAKELKFDDISKNSIDSVSNRDFIIEILSTISILFMHLSRLSEDFIIWLSKEFNLLEIDESFCTGSSIMPHKKNPDVLELVRGLSSEVYGNTFSMFVLLKGLPTSYNRDLQLDKKYLFNSVDLTLDTLKILKQLILSIKINKKTAKELVNNEYLYITDIAEWLVEKGMPFREAHFLMGKVIKYSKDNNLAINKIPIGELKKISNFFDDDFYSLFDAEKSVTSKFTYNSTNPSKVNKKIKEYMEGLK